jgi:hypothetical protein
MGKKAFSDQLSAVSCAKKQLSAVGQCFVTA